MDGVDVLQLHLPPALGRRVARQSIFVNLVLRLAPGWQGTKTDLIKLLPVESPMIVAARADWLREDNRGRVDGLPDLLPVTQSSDLLDQNRSQALGPQLVVHADEVDLSGIEDLLAYAQLDRDGGDEGDELAGLRCPDPDRPLAFPAWACEVPLQNTCPVVEPEHLVGVLDVMSIH